MSSIIKKVQALFSKDRMELLGKTNITLALFIICTPSIFDTISMFIDFSVIEAYLGHLSPQHLVAMSMWFPFYFVLNIICLNGASLGGSITISNLLGRKRKALAERIATGYLYNQIVLTFIMFSFAYYMIEIILKIFGVPEDAKELTITFIKYMIIANYFSVIRNFLADIARAEGSTLYPLVSNFINIIVTATLGYILIFVYNMGVVGAGLASIAGTTTSFTIILSIFLSNKTYLNLNFLQPIFKLKHYLMYIKNGSPSFMLDATQIAIYLFIFNLLKSYGSIAVASFTMLETIILFILMLISGIMYGYRTIASFCVGAGDFVRFREAYWSVVKVIAMFNIPFNLICILFPNALASIFSDTKEVQDLAINGIIAFGIVTFTFFLSESINGLYISIQKTFIPNMALTSRFAILIIGSYIFIDEYGAAAPILFLSLCEIGFQVICISQLIFNKQLRRYLIFNKYNSNTFEVL